MWGTQTTGQQMARDPAWLSLWERRAGLLFHYLGLTTIDRMDWLGEEVEDWDNYDSYNVFKEFVIKLNCVNDPAERTVRMAKDFLGSSRTEEQLQDNYIVVADHRKRVKSTKQGKLSKAALKNAGGSSKWIKFCELFVTFWSIKVKNSLFSLYSGGQTLGSRRDVSSSIKRSLIELKL